MKRRRNEFRGLRRIEGGGRAGTREEEGKEGGREEGREDAGEGGELNKHGRVDD